MLKRIILATVMAVSASIASAATFEYDIAITSISGNGQAENIGFFSTGSVGDTGTGSADISEDVPLDYAETLYRSLFGASFAGIATAGSQAGNSVTHDTVAGTITVDGFLGGVTGPYAEFLSAGTFEFVYTGVAGGPEISTTAGLESFLAGATMSGYFVGTFEANTEFYTQRIDFGAVSKVPLPAGGVLLLSAIGLMAAKRRKS